MNDNILAIGSLSNDLYRVACMAQRGSITNALRFLKESSRSIKEINLLPPYLKKIIKDIDPNAKEINLKTAEKYLMYSTLLQNFVLHHKVE